MSKRGPSTTARGAALWAILPLAALALPASTDTVTLADDKELEGRVVYEDEKELVLRVGSRDRTIALSLPGT